MDTIQLSGIFNDSKIFVDMPMKYDPSVVQDNFNLIPNVSDINELKTFLSENFDEAGSDLDQFIPTDIQDSPGFIAGLTNEQYKRWASDLNQLWKVLGKVTAENVSLYPQRHSFIPMKYPMIVPGKSGLSSLIV